MNHCITTLADLMNFSPNQDNHWALPLITSQFPLIKEILPPDATAHQGHRYLRTGQSCFLEHVGGQHGHIRENFGINLMRLLNDRKRPAHPTDNMAPGQHYPTQKLKQG